MDKKREPSIKVGNVLLQIILIKVPTQIFLSDLISHLVSHQLNDFNWKVVSCSITVDLPSSYFQRQESSSCNVKKYVTRSLNAVIKIHGPLRNSKCVILLIICQILLSKYAKRPNLFTVSPCPLRFAAFLYIMVSITLPK